MDYNYGPLGDISPKDIPDGDVIVLRKNSESTGGVWCSGGKFDVIEHRPRPLEPGDKVKTAYDRFADIVYINENWAWIKFKYDSGSDVLYPVKDLTLVSRKVENT